MAFQKMTNASVSVSNATIADANIRSISITESITNGNNLTLGNSCSTTAEIKLIEMGAGSGKSFVKGKTITVILSRDLDSEDNTKESFSESFKLYIDSVDVITKKNGNCDITVKAMDGFINGGKRFEYSKDNIKTSDLFTEICKQLNVSEGKMIGNNNLVIETSYLNNKSIRQCAEILAGVCGGVAFFSHDGRLNISFLGQEGRDSVSLSANQIYLDQVKLNTSNETETTITDEDGSSTNKTTNEITIDGVTCNAGGSILHAGGNSIISYSCETNSAENLEDIQKNTIKKISPYTPVEVKWTGNPSIPIMSSFSVPDGDNSYGSYLMERTIEYDGSLYEIYKSLEPSKSVPKDESSGGGGGGFNGGGSSFNTPVTIGVGPLTKDGKFNANYNLLNLWSVATVTYSPEGNSEYIHIDIQRMGAGYTYFIPTVKYQNILFGRPIELIACSVNSDENLKDFSDSFCKGYNVDCPDEPLYDYSYVDAIKFDADLQTNRLAKGMSIYYAESNFRRFRHNSESDYLEEDYESSFGGGWIIVHNASGNKEYVSLTFKTRPCNRYDKYPAFDTEHFMKYKTYGMYTAEYIENFPQMYKLNSEQLDETTGVPYYSYPYEIDYYRQKAANAKDGDWVLFYDKPYGWTGYFE